MSLIDRLPEHLKNRKTAEAVTAPSALLLAGAGTAVGVLAGAALPVAVLVGAAAYGVRVAFGLPRKPRPERIDLAGLSQPWRAYVKDAMEAQRRYTRAVSTTEPGPLHDRLGEIGARLDAGVRECYRIGRRGAALDTGLAGLQTGVAWADLMHGLDAFRVPAQLRERVQQGESIRDNAELAGELRKVGVDEQGLDKLEALQAQVLSAQRLAAVAQDARSRLELLNARLDEAVARAVELSLRAEDATALQGLGGDVDDLVGEMESLRTALDEAGRAGRGATATGTA
ncbi:MAG TPA: hypothetical protein VKE97_03210 [Acidimicrobiia bacterium]|nr:hypothetical protein [Acidimicrobiia bacterium]